jgi:hypothetical protein
LLQKPFDTVGRCNVIHIKKQAAIPLFLMLTVPPVQNAAAAPPDVARYQLQTVDAEMSADDYRRVYRDNQHRVGKFITHYSEQTLQSFGLPKSGIRVAGALAGAAMNQDATVYLNSSKWLALDIKDAVQGDRSILFAIKHSW